MAVIFGLLLVMYFGGLMQRIFNRSLDLFLSTLLIFGGAVAGASLLSFYSSSSVTGFISGGIFGIIVLALPKLVEMNLRGAGMKFQMKLDAAAQDAKQARALAQLVVGIALDIGNRPQGVMGGGLISQNDKVRKLLAEQLAEIGIDRKEASDFAAIDEKYIASRLKATMILPAVAQASAGGTEKAKELLLPLRGENAAKEPERIVQILGPDLMADPDVRKAMDFYRQWYESDEKLYFIVDNFNRIHEAEAKLSSRSIASPG